MPTLRGAIVTPTERERRRRATITWRLVVNSYPCLKCGVPPGRSCRTDMGRPTDCHAERSQSAAARGWAFADAPARCVRCHRPLAGDNPEPGMCARCLRDARGKAPSHATADNPGPDGSYDVPLFGEES